MIHGSLDISIFNLLLGRHSTGLRWAQLHASSLKLINCFTSNLKFFGAEFGATNQEEHIGVADFGCQHKVICFNITCIFLYGSSYNIIGLYYG